MSSPCDHSRERRLTRSRRRPRAGKSSTWSTRSTASSPGACRDRALPRGSCWGYISSTAKSSDSSGNVVDAGSYDGLRDTIALRTLSSSVGLYDALRQTVLTRFSRRGSRPQGALLDHASDPLPRRECTPAIRACNRCTCAQLSLPATDSGLTSPTTRASKGICIHYCPYVAHLQRSRRR